MSYQILGTCSHCRGPVAVPQMWSGTLPPTPRCLQCGQSAAGNYGPTIQTIPANTGSRMYPAYQTRPMTPEDVAELMKRYNQTHSFTLNEEKK